MKKFGSWQSVRLPHGSLCAAVLSAWTGDGSGYQVAQKQPMKLAAMEGYYEGRQGAGLVAFGLLNPAKQTPQDGVDPFLFPCGNSEDAVAACRAQDGCFCSRHQ